jgi:hypothetical protein
MVGAQGRERDLANGGLDVLFKNVSVSLLRR